MLSTIRNPYLRRLAIAAAVPFLFPIALLATPLGHLADLLADMGDDLADFQRMVAAAWADPTTPEA